MKHILKYSFGCLLWMAATIITLSMVSCDDSDASSDLDSAIYPKSVLINIPAAQQQLIYTDEAGASVLPLIKGESVALSYTFAPDDITFNEFDWTSSNTSVATVDQDGTITAVSGNGTGYAIVQVAPSVFYSGSNIYSTLKVVVANSMVPATSITISSTADEVFAGETAQLTATILPDNATYKTVKWSSSNESIATVDASGLVTGKVNENYSAIVTITATSLDGAQVLAKKDITVKQIVVPESVTIDQSKSVDKGYVFAIADKGIALSYTTVPAVSTTSLIEWTSSDANIATVQAGVVTFNQEGVFGDVTITATCPETGNASSIKLHLAEGLVRELFHDQNNYGWYNAAQSGNGTSSSHVWSYGKVTVTTYKQNDTNQRGDFKCWNAKTFLHAGNYPIFAIRMDDALDYTAATSRNITLDASGSCNGASYSGGLAGNNNKWLNDYKCSDGSHVFIYNLSTQAWANGGVLPTNALATFPTLQFKYADIRTLTAQFQYNVYWIQTFKTIDDVKAYIESEGLTYDIIK
ncbi:Ig-like domain-containing protein [Bacteroides sp. 51]|uniref:Ig-like domain-containing protein n=1 Tax=Bacteroides sp. 51 TaxID=2302938 RepID=UPI0013D4E282|nr:Ig-like domain-containing protein [Bacteroides sp. 51]NDV83663.1 DUF4979 domain-containing protein [Bacteroides sp. 51]